MHIKSLEINTEHHNRLKTTNKKALQTWYHAFEKRGQQAEMIHGKCP